VRAEHRKAAESALGVAAEARRLFPRRCHLGLEPNAAQLLLGLALAQFATPDEAAHALELDPSTVRHALRDLERDGLITRTPDPADRRRRGVHLSDSGRLAAGRLAEALAATRRSR
jgi:DNA-binding MarR family transcriptional regulator